MRVVNCPKTLKQTRVRMKISLIRFRNNLQQTIMKFCLFRDISKSVVRLFALKSQFYGLNSWKAHVTAETCFDMRQTILC